MGCTNPQHERLAPPPLPAQHIDGQTPKTLRYPTNKKLEMTTAKMCGNGSDSEDDNQESHESSFDFKTRQENSIKGECIQEVVIRLADQKFDDEYRKAKDVRRLDPETIQFRDLKGDLKE